MKVQETFSDLTLRLQRPLNDQEVKTLIEKAKQDNKGWNCCSADTSRGTDALFKIAQEEQNQDKFDQNAKKALDDFFLKNRKV